MSIDFSSAPVNGSIEISEIGLFAVAYFCLEEKNLCEKSMTEGQKIKNAPAFLPIRKRLFLTVMSRYMIFDMRYKELSSD